MARRESDNSRSPRRAPEWSKISDAAVIIPWGGGHVQWLIEQLDAVLDASNTASERGIATQIILSCNGVGSIDSARRLLSDRMLGEANIDLVDSSDRPGPAHARNVGADRSSAPLLLFCDADDIVDADWIWQMVEAADSADILRGRLDPSRNRFGIAPSSGDAAVPQPIYGHLGYGPMSNLAIQRAAYLAVGGTSEDLRIGEDVDLCWRAQYEGATFGVAPEATVYLRWRPTLLGHFKQSFAWGRGDVELLSRHRARGARPTRPLRFAGQLVKLPFHLVAGIFDGHRRWTSVHRAGKILGRSIESMRRGNWSV